MPLLDGSRGIDFTSPHGSWQVDVTASPFDHLREGGDPRGAPGGGAAKSEDAPQGAAAAEAAAANIKADAKELQLLAYCLRLLERKSLLMHELKQVCTEAERELKRICNDILVKVDSGITELHVPTGLLQPLPIRIEVTAAQQRVLGQVPPPPEIPALGGVYKQLKATEEHEEVTKLERRVAIWRQEIEWLQVISKQEQSSSTTAHNSTATPRLTHHSRSRPHTFLPSRAQDELRSTARALDTALSALRPTAQRFSLALGAAAPEPQSRGLGGLLCRAA